MEVYSKDEILPEISTSFCDERERKIRTKTLNY